jgi:predicted GNAT family acetyltransferase
MLYAEVPQRLSGQGVGSRLVHAIFDNFRKRKRRVIAKCPFMAAYAARHAKYLSMLDG